MGIYGTTPVLGDARMRELGFTDDHNEGYWFYSRSVGSGVACSFNINKLTGDYTEDVDEDLPFGRPVFYGLLSEPSRTRVRDGVDAVVAELNAAGLTLTVDHTLYLFKEGA